MSAGPERDAAGEGGGDGSAAVAVGAGRAGPGADADAAADAALRDLVEQVRDAAAAGRALEIVGGGSKAFLGGPRSGEPLSTATLTGIVAHEPSELVVTVRAGTPLAELEAALAAHGQCLPFEPPRFAPSTTVGGMVAAGLAGPARAAVGGLRDYLLGAVLLNGRAEVLHFGGQVMKNVAGYDVARALAGSMGVLGVICEVSLKVLPVAASTATLRLELDEAEALRALNAWAGQPLPLNASAWWNGTLVLRLSGAAAAVRAACARIGGEPIEPALAASFWRGLRDHADEFFDDAARAIADDGAELWRLSVPSTAPVLPLGVSRLTEWGGAQRWIVGRFDPAAVQQAAAAVGGHAVRFRGGAASRDAAGVAAPLPEPLVRIHRALKDAFDPAGIFNRGRLGVAGL